MFLAVLFAIVSVSVGALLGLWPGARARWLSPVRGLAVGAGVAVAFVTLLPEAIAQIGPLALVPFAAAFAVPRLIELLARTRLPRASAEVPGHPAMLLGLELGYAGLLVHQLVDGLTMGAYAGASHADALHGVRLDVFLAVAGHTVPVTAAVALAFLEHRGRASALGHALGLAVPVVLGVALAQADIAGRLIVAHGAWVSSIASGLLLHVVLHGTHADGAAQTPSAPWLRSRKAKILGIVVGAGLVLALVPGHTHEGHQESALTSELPVLLAAALTLVALHFALRHGAHASSPGPTPHAGSPADR